MSNKLYPWGEKQFSDWSRKFLWFPKIIEGKLYWLVYVFYRTENYPYTDFPALYHYKTKRRFMIDELSGKNV